MKLNKTLASALLLSVALTGCDSIVKNDNTAENTPVVEENTDAPAETTENEATETVETETTTDEAANNEETNEADNAETTETAGSEVESAESGSSDFASLSNEEKIEALEEAIFNNRSSARAVELLFELSPDKVAGQEDKLNALLERSNTLIEEAQQAIEALRAQ